MIEPWEKDTLRAIYDNKLDVVRELLSTNPDVVHHRINGYTLLHKAVAAASYDIVEFLIEHGADVNACIKSGDDETDENALNRAIDGGNVAIVDLLLKRGADPRRSRPAIAAVTGAPEHALEFIKQLEKYGADLHRLFPFGENYRPINALSMAKVYGLTDVVEYLLSRGARMPEQYSAEEVAAYFDRFESPDASRAQSSSSSYADQTLAYFTEHFGPVDPLLLIEIAPTEPQVTVHFIPADASRKCVTLFTTGLAEAEMKAPDEEGAADFRYAELFLQLPADWKYREYEDPRYAWPIHWMRTIARYPVAADAWLGGPATIFAAGEPLGPELKFDSWLLMAERKFAAHDGRTVQLYRLTPLYPEERELEDREGIGALLRAFDKHGTPFVIDPNRRNVAT